MLFSSILAVMAATLASAASSTSGWSSTSTSAEYGYTIQPACPGQLQPSGRYTYNSSNPFPITTNATVHGSTPATTTSSKSGSTSGATTTGTATTSSGVVSFTGAASRQNVDVMGAMGGLGLFAAAVALL